MEAGDINTKEYDPGHIKQLKEGDFEPLLPARTEVEGDWLGDAKACDRNDSECEACQ